MNAHGSGGLEGFHFHIVWGPSLLTELPFTYTGEAFFKWPGEQVSYGPGRRAAPGALLHVIAELNLAHDFGVASESPHVPLAILDALISG